MIRSVVEVLAAAGRYIGWLSGPLQGVEHLTEPAQITTRGAEGRKRGEEPPQVEWRHRGIG